MRSSTVIALALVAAAGPALSAPVATSNFARADTPSTSAPTDVSSEAISLGAVSTIASVAAPLVGGIIDYFKNKGNQKQRRDALELESLLARAEDESDAISLGAVSTIASFAAPLVGGIIDHFRNKGKREDIEQLFARADLEELFAREDFEELLARAVEDQDSEAVRLGTVANVASIGSSILSAFQGLWQRDESLLSRSYSSSDDEDVSGALFDGLRHHYAPGTFHIMRADSSEGEDSEAIKLGTVANIAGIGSSLVSAFHSIFGREDVMDLMARGDDEDVSAALSTLIRSGRFNPYVSHGPVRLPKFQVARADATDDSSEAIRLGQVADIASIGSSVVSAWHSIFGRDLLLSRAEEEGQDSEAIKLGTVANIAGIGSSVVSMFHNLFGRSDTGVFAPLARASVDSDDSSAIVLRPGMHPIRIPSSFSGLNLRIGRSEDAEAESAALFLKGLHGIGRLGPQHWGVKRDVLEFLARAETTEESDAIKLGTLGNIASIGGSVISALHNLFSGNSKREITSILARADEDSAAIKLSTLGNIASIGGSVISAIHNLFSSGSQQQKREFLEILQRAAVEDGFVARSLNELD